MSNKILVACEESQVVTIAFREVGLEAYSCDIQEPSGGHPEWHIKADVLEVLKGDWLAIIAFPPCTHLSSSGARWWAEKQADGRQQEAIRFFMRFFDTHCEYVAVENPIGRMSTAWRKPDQIIQPWMFGHGEQKATCLWLRNFPKLEPTNIVDGREQKMWYMGPSPERAKLRSKTYPGIARAMAHQWGAFLKEKTNDE